MPIDENTVIDVSRTHVDAKGYVLVGGHRGRHVDAVYDSDPSYIRWALSKDGWTDMPTAVRDELEELLEMGVWRPALPTTLLPPAPNDGGLHAAGSTMRPGDTVEVVTPLPPRFAKIGTKATVVSVAPDGAFVLQATNGARTAFPFLKAARVVVVARALPGGAPTLATPAALTPTVTTAYAPAPPATASSTKLSAATEKFKASMRFNAAMRETLRQDGVLIDGNGDVLPIDASQYLDTACVECRERQFSTKSGVSCKNGHGGADGRPMTLTAAAKVAAHPVVELDLPEAPAGPSGPDRKPTMRVGDIFEDGFDIRVNTVNCVGVMGAGLAKQFADRYPGLLARYKRACESGEVQPGRLYVWRYGLTWVVNFPTKRHWRGASRYEDVAAGLDALRELLAPLRDLRVAVPALGCSLGGLDWRRVWPMIVEKLSGLAVDIVCVVSREHHDLIEKALSITAPAAVAAPQVTPIDLPDLDDLPDFDLSDDLPPLDDLLALDGFDDLPPLDDVPSAPHVPMPAVVAPNKSIITAADKRASFAWTLTDDQQRAHTDVKEWANGKGPRIRSLTGFGGTGKSTLVRSLLTHLPNVHLSAMTGKAALRLRDVTDRAATTLHAVLYMPPEEKQGSDLAFSARRAPTMATLVVDEASLITPQIYTDLQEWAALGVRVLLVGDPFQLPPVLSKKEIEVHGEDFTVFEKVQGSVLTKVMRSAGPIVAAATYIRENKRVLMTSDGGYRFDRSRDTLQSAINDYLADPEDHVLITWTNALRLSANRQIRARLGFKGKLPERGEPVLIRQNQGAFLNGEIVIADHWYPGPTIGGDELTGAGGLPTTWLVTSDGSEILTLPQGYAEWMDGGRPHIEDWYAWLEYGRDLDRRPLDKNGTPCPIPVPVTYGFCLTAHAAQGSEWRRTTMFLGANDSGSKNFRKLTKLPSGEMVPFSIRFLYTALTRAKSQATLYVSR